MFSLSHALHTSLLLQPISLPFKSHENNGSESIFKQTAINLDFHGFASRKG